MVLLNLGDLVHPEVLCLRSYREDHVLPYQPSDASNQCRPSADSDLEATSIDDVSGISRLGVMVLEEVFTRLEVTDEVRDVHQLMFLFFRSAFTSLSSFLFRLGLTGLRGLVLQI